MSGPHWHPDHTPAMRLEAAYGDRTVRCFIERPQSMHSLLERAVAAHGDSDAVVCGALHWSYRELDAEVARIAAGLAAQGVAAGERVALFMGNQPAFVAMLFALQRLGAIAVPIGEREQKPGLAYMLAQCSACAIVFDAALAERIPDAAEVPALRLRIAASGAVAGALALDTLGTSGEAPAGIAAVQEQDTALILYTSGTTGRPKGAMLTHLNVAHSVRHYEVCMGLRSGDRSALAVPASHVTGLIAVIAAMVHVGGAIVILPEFKAASFLQTMEAERITYTLMCAGDVHAVPPARVVREYQSLALAHRWLRRCTDAGVGHRHPGRSATGADVDQCLRRDGDHLADHDDARRPHARPCRHRRRAAALRRRARDG